MTLFGKRPRLDSLAAPLSRDELLRRSRILVVDDERPDLIDDLEHAHFAVQYVADITKDNIDLIERPLYDLVLLDFGNVGNAFGHDSGLSLLRHMKRVNPALVVLAYTSKSLGTEHADFYRLADGVLAKDDGIGESTQKIEEALRKAHSIDNLWKGVLAVAGIAPNSKQDLEWQALVVKGSKDRRKLAILKDKVRDAIGSEAAEKVITGLVGKILEVSLKAVLGP
jgi:DNA-binding response OmpR family regulator